MEVVYTALGLAEVFVLLASAMALAFLILRAIIRSIFAKKKDETQRVPSAEEMRYLKRADSRISG
jgi:hypothetical protein